MEHAADPPSAFRQHLQALGERFAHPTFGFFGPQSVAWKVNREAVLMLGGMRALLMQVAHPKVAQGVADHSRFRDQPFQRAMSTFRAVHTIVFGSQQEAVDMAYRVHCVHNRVQGKVVDPIPELSDTSYSANDPDLLMWVFGTLFDSALLGYDQYLPRLRASERTRFYKESMLFARLFGVPDDRIPPDLYAFHRWMDDMLTGSELVVTPTAREIALSLLDGIVFPAISRPLHSILAAGMLPDPLREAFGIPWGRRSQIIYGAGTQSIRRLIGRLPKRIRWIPAAIAADSGASTHSKKQAGRRWHERIRR